MAAIGVEFLSSALLTLFTLAVKFSVSIFKALDLEISPLMFLINLNAEAEKEL
jgi:hypothetical protein